MERSNVRLFTRDIASIEEVGGEATSELLNQTAPTPLSFIGSRYRTSTTRPRQQTHIPSVHDYNTSCHNNAPMIHALLLFPCIQFFAFHICMYFPSSLQLTWLANPALVTSVYPNRMQYMPRVLQEVSLLDGVDAGVRGNGRRFSKTSSYPPCCRYAFIFFYPYFLTTSSSPLFLLIHSLLTTHYASALSYESLPHSLSPLFSLLYWIWKYFLLMAEQRS